MAKSNEILYSLKIDAASGEASLARFRGEATKTEGALKSIRDGLAKGFQIGGGLAAVQAMTGSLSELAGNAIEFDKNIRNVGSLGVQNFRAIGDELLTLSKTVPKSAGDLANATYQAISAGIDPTKVISFVEQASKTAVAGQSTTEQAVNGLTSVLNAYKLKTEDASQVSDQFFGAIKFGKTTFNELNSGLASVVPTAASVGVGFDQVTGAVAAMTNQGVPTVQATTQIRQALVELQKPGKDLSTIMTAAGVSLEDLKNPQIGLVGVLQKVNVEAAKQGKTMTQVFSSVEAGSAALLLSGENFERAAGALSNIRGATGSANEAFDVMNQSLDSQLQIAKNYVSAALIPMAQTLLGGVLKGIEFARNAFEGLSRFVSQNKTALLVLGGAIAGLTILMNANAITTAIVTNAQRIWAVATKGVDITMKLLNGTMAANPIGLLVVGITAAIGVFSLFSSKVKSVGDASADLADSFKEFNEQNEKAKSIEDTANKTDKLSTAYDTLSKNTKRTKEEDEELKRVTKELDEATGGAATAVDNYGNIVSIATGKVREMTDEQRKLAAGMRETAVKNMQADMRGLVASIQKARAELTDLEKDATEPGLLNSIGVALRLSDSVVDDNRERIRQLVNETDAGLRQLADVLVKGNFRDIGFENLITLGLSKEDARQVVGYIQQIKDASAGAVTDTKDLTKERAAQKQTDEDLLAIAKQLASESTNRFEIEQKLALAKRGQNITTADQLELSKQALENLKKEINERNLLANKKYTLKAQLALDDAQIKTLELQIKVRAELTQLTKDIDDVKSEIAQQEIELGIRPRSDGLGLIQRQIDELQSGVETRGKEIAARIAASPFGSVIDAETQRMILEHQKMQNALLGAQGQYNTLSIDLQRQLTDARIDNIADEQRKEIAQLNLQQEEKLQFVKDAIDAGRDLTKGELALKEQLEIAYGRKLVEIRKKYAKEAAVAEVNLASAASDAITRGLESAFAERKRLSDAEYDDKQVGFDRQLQQLRNMLASGELSQRDYNNKLKLLDEERARFEEENNNSVVKRIGDAVSAGLTSLADRYQKYFEDLAFKYFVDALLHTQAEQSKTDATVDGADARAQAEGKAAPASVTSGNASIFSAAAAAVSKALAELPWFVAIPAGIAAAFAIKTALTGIRGLLGFATGGLRLGLQGEVGPEIVGPTKDFSQFATQLILRTALQVEKALMNRENGKGGRFTSDTNINVTGVIRGSGRDLQATLYRNSISNRSETFAQAA